MNKDFLQKAFRRDAFLKFLCNKKLGARDAQLAAGKIVALQHHAFNFYIANGELVVRAERKVRPSTHIPDLDNANVGIFVVITGNFKSEVSRFVF